MTLPIPKELQRVINNPDALVLYNEAMSLLFQTGIFDYLRWIARPQMLGSGSDVQAMAAQAARSSGFNEALDLLLNFKEVLEAAIPTAPPSVVPDYGGGQAAVEAGLLTKEELDAARHGHNVDYAQYIAPTSGATKGRAGGTGASGQSA